MGRLTLLGIVFVAGLAAYDQADALTIYRLGGEDLPVPEQASEAGVDFVQLMWEEVDEDLFGSYHQIELAEFVEPVRLDPNVNLTPLLRDRGGVVKLNNSYSFLDHPSLDLLFDGDYETAFSGLPGDQSGSAATKSIWFGLAGLFPISRVVIQPTTEHHHDRFIPQFTLGTNDGDIKKNGTREGSYHFRGRFVDYEIRFQRTENTTPLLDLQLPDEPIENIYFLALHGNWEIAEFEIYGDGFASRANYTSNVLDLGGRSSLGNLVWSGSQDPGAGIDLSMRSGDDTDPNLYWRITFRGSERSRLDHQGKPLTRRSYKSLEGGEKGGIAPDHENWEFWAPPVDFKKGESVLAGTKPRRFVQFKADLNSTRGSAGTRIDYLQFEVSHPPVASEVVAEIFPTTVPVGEIRPFTYKIAPTIGGDDLGFDSIEIRTPIAPAGVDAVRIGSRSLAADEYKVGAYDGNRFSVRVPRVDLQQSGELIEIDFRCEVFKVGTVFSSRVFNSVQPLEVRQRVTEGDADALTESNTLSVDPKEVGQSGIRKLEVSGFTPNGDGVNDQLEVQYDLVNLSKGVPASLRVFNLAGDPIAEIAAEEGNSGRFSARWDGRDENGKVVLPGLYLLRLQVEADRGTDIAVATVPLVY